MYLQSGHLGSILRSRVTFQQVLTFEITEEIQTGAAILARRAQAFVDVWSIADEAIESDFKVPTHLLQTRDELTESGQIARWSVVTEACSAETEQSLFDRI